MAAYSSAAILEPQVEVTTAMGLPRSSGCLNCFCRLASKARLSKALRLSPSSKPLATNLTRPLTLRRDRSASHPADELDFDIRKQHKDSDTQR